MPVLLAAVATGVAALLAVAGLVAPPVAEGAARR